MVLYTEKIQILMNQTNLNYNASYSTLQMRIHNYINFYQKILLNTRIELYKSKF